MRRLLPILLGLVVVIGGGYLILTVVHGRDAAGVAGAPTAEQGDQEPDRGNAVRDGAGVGRYADPPPTSGTHARSTPTREGRIDDATLLTALALGNVALVYDGARPPQALRAVQERESGAFDPELAAAGAMVLLVRRDGVDGVQALAWRHRLQVASPEDPALGDFAQRWLGAGAAG